MDTLIQKIYFLMMKIKKSEWANQYFGWTEPLPRIRAVNAKSFKLNCEPYTEKGRFTWDEWTFNIWTTCSIPNLSYDQTWRMATTLLPKNVRSVVVCCNEMWFYGIVLGNLEGLLSKGSRESGPGGLKCTLAFCMNTISLNCFAVKIWLNCFALNLHWHFVWTHIPIAGSIIIICKVWLRTNY